MKKYLITVWLIVVSLLLVIATSCSRDTTNSNKDPYRNLFKKPGSTTKQKLPFDTIAKINVDKITPALLKVYSTQKRKSRYSEKNYSDEQKAEDLKELINLVLLSQKAQQEYFHKVKLVEEHLHFQRMALLARLYLDKFSSEINISEQDLQTAYRERYLKTDHYEYKTSHIVVKTREKAVVLIAALRRGASFRRLAKKHSIGPSSDFGGALAWSSEKNILKPFVNAIKSMQVGHYSDEPVHTRHGWHIILLEAKRKTSPPKFSEVRKEIEKTLREDKLEQHIKQLREKSHIIINSSSWPKP